MKYIVVRTSDLGYNKKPCEEAVEMEIIGVDERKIPSFEKYEKITGESWFNFGFNHEEVKGKRIRRNYIKKVWCVEIDTLEELMNFRKKYGKLIIGTSYLDYKTPEIEIYDDYRE